MMNNLFNYKFMIIKFINFFKSGTMKVRSLLFLALLFCVVIISKYTDQSVSTLEILSQRGQRLCIE